MKKITTILLSLALLTSCVDSLDDYNIDQKKAQTVTPETLFSAALKNLSDILTTPAVGSNNFRLYTQQWTTTAYLDEPRYVLTSRTIPQAFWDALYRDVLSDLKEAKRVLEADQLLAEGIKNNRLAQITIVEVYAWSVLVNTFGNIPYKQALDINNSLPEYNDANEIYIDLLDRLDAALPMLNTASAGFGNGELFYASKSGLSNKIDYWKKLGNSVKLKLAMVLADVDADRAKAAVMAVTAAAENLITSNDQSARFPYINDAPNNNPVATNTNSLFTSRQDFIAANTIVNAMNELNDPRRKFYFTTVGTAYIGGLYGFQNEYANFSKMSARVIAPNTEALLLDYSEVEFLLAEAIERTFITGDAAEHYNKAITASITYWGGTEAEAMAYLAQPEVNYATAEGDFKQKIGTQKWIALFNRGWDAWMEWKRLDYPQLLPPSGEGIQVELKIPVRLIYPISEQTLNGANRATAADEIGGDLATTKLFWDEL
jgi:hypothetical protein